MGTVEPDSTPGELSAQLADIPAGMRLVDCFGDRTLVLVYGSAAVEASDVVAAVVASLGTWNR